MRGWRCASCCAPPSTGWRRADYGEPDLSRVAVGHACDRGRAREAIPAKSAQLDVRMTTALLALGRDVAMGRVAAAGDDQSVMEARSGRRRTSSPRCQQRWATAASWTRGWTRVRPRASRVRRAAEHAHRPCNAEAAGAGHAGRARGADCAEPGALALDAGRARRRGICSSTSRPTRCWWARTASRCCDAVTSASRTTNADLQRGDGDRVFSPYWNIPESICGGGDAAAATTIPTTSSATTSRSCRYRTAGRRRSGVGRLGQTGGGQCADLPPEAGPQATPSAR